MKTSKKIEIIEKLANKENCDGECNLKYPYVKCSKCESRSFLNKLDNNLSNLMSNIIKNLKDSPPEFNKTVDDNFWELI